MVVFKHTHARTHTQQDEQHDKDLLCARRHCSEEEKKNSRIFWTKLLRQKTLIFQRLLRSTLWHTMPTCVHVSVSVCRYVICTYFFFLFVCLQLVYASVHKSATGSRLGRVSRVESLWLLRSDYIGGTGGVSRLVALSVFCVVDWTDTKRMEMAHPETVGLPPRVLTGIQTHNGFAKSILDLQVVFFFKLYNLFVSNLSWKTWTLWEFRNKECTFSM